MSSDNNTAEANSGPRNREADSPLDVRASMLRMVKPASRAVVYGIRDRFISRITSSLDQVPPRPDAVSNSWLAAALSRSMKTNIDVAGFRYSAVDNGTNVRGRIEVRYDESSTGGGSSGPRNLFVKSTPSVVTRLANAVTMKGEAAFYTTLRPRLAGLEIPMGYHSAVDLKTLRSVHLLEDLVATKDATFPSDPSVVLTYEQACDAVDLLADVHRSFADWRGDELPTYVQFWSRALGIADVGKSIRAFQTDDFCPESLRASGNALWDACRRSVEMHAQLPRTLIHNDPHRGNWYVTGRGKMGLLDWQTTCFGHWSRDVAYALPALLTIDQRRQWESQLIARYHKRSNCSESLEESWLLYRQQLVSGLLFWAPTLRPPRGFPEMQPRPLAIEMLERIATAVVDNDSIGLLQIRDTATATNRHHA